jgi:putative inorganic carbon (hco3(-)) transporter
MGAINTFGQSDSANGFDGSTTDGGTARRTAPRPEPLAGAYVALLLFVFLYFARLKDWMPGLSEVPLAKITGILALLALVFSLPSIRHRLPREVFLLTFLVAQLYLASAVSPVWRGGALQATLDFTKVLIIVVVITLAVNSLKRLKRLIYIQAASVAVIATATLWKGHMIGGRLNGILGGSYSDPNDLALSMVVSLPLCLALLFLSRRIIWKALWTALMLAMTYAVFLTGSRGGFLALSTATAICLWEFAIRGRRRYLLVLAALVSVVVLPVASGMVFGRLKGTFDINDDASAAYTSSQARQQLLRRSVEITGQHPLFGVGPGNFAQVSGNWHVAHNSFTQMSAEGGIPAFLLYVLILWAGFKNVRAIKSLARGKTEEIVLARGLQASLGGFVVGSLFATFSYEFFPYMLVAYSTALFLLAKESASRSKREEPSRRPEMDVRTHLDSAGNEMVWHAG